MSIVLHYKSKTQKYIFYRFSARQMVVRLGEHHLLNSDGKGIQEYKVTSLKPHPQFQRHGFYNDIGVVRLARPVQFSDYIQPVCLPHSRASSSKPMVGVMATVVGWGAMNYGLFLFIICLRVKCTCVLQKNIIIAGNSPSNYLI